MYSCTVLLPLEVLQKYLYAMYMQKYVRTSVSTSMKNPPRHYRTGDCVDTSDVVVVGHGNPNQLILQDFKPLLLQVLIEENLLQTQNE